jgi:hypothetical protein
MSASALAPTHNRDTRYVVVALSASIRAASSAYSSDPFPVNRGVTQGDVVSPLYFIIALESIVRRHSGAGRQTALTAFGILIDRLEYVLK